MKLFLKGMRCSSQKCSFDRRSYIPGQHGEVRRSKLTEYALQLREKQKVKRIYGLLERQFKNYFRKAARTKGVTGELLLQFLETRLDSVVFNLGFSVSRSQARQIIRHGHVFINGGKVDLPAYQVRAGDVVQIKGKEGFLEVIKEIRQICKERQTPLWIEVKEPSFEGKVLRLPKREDIGFPIKESLIVELYSK
jgi:small subunit ribosomal protein S4